MRSIIITVIALICITATGGLAQNQKRGLQPSDFYSEVTIGGVALSPDGELLAFAVTSIDEERNKRHTEIWMQQLEKGRPEGEPFRFTDPTEESSSPRWSPEGSLLSFQSKRGDDENSTWFMRVKAPGGEAFHIEGVESTPVWSPDGQWIATLKRPDKEEDEDEEEDGSGKEEPEKKKKKRPEREGWIAPDALTNTLDAKRFDGRVITLISYKRDGSRALIPHRSVREKTQIYLVEASGGEARRLTSLAFNAGSLEWSRDNKTIFFTGNELEDDELNEELTSELYAVSIGGGEPRTLTTNPGSERGAAVSPDGKRLAYLFSADRGEPTDLMVVDIDADGSFKGAPRNLTAAWDYSPGAPSWGPKSRTIRFTSGITGNSHLFEVDARNGDIEQVTSGDRTLRGVDISEDGKVMAYTVTDPLNVSDLYVARSDGERERRLTSFNDEWMEGIDLQSPERVIWKVADRSEIEGWLIKPLGFDPAKKYPMVLKIHGGPHSAYGNYWFRTFHVLSASGMFVFYPNPRGSSGYGHDFTYATRGRWGEMDSEDYLNGVDTVLDLYPSIDRDRVGVSGGSYGGFMSNWLTATTDRFAASVTSRSITNWESWYGASDAQRLTEYEFYGPPWEQRDLYRRLSPITHVENVTAPTLIIHSENDYRTPIADGEQWFMALMKREVPAELVRYPRSSHGLSRTGEPWLLVDRLERLRSWFVHWLAEERDEEEE